MSRHGAMAASVSPNALRVATGSAYVGSVSGGSGVGGRSTGSGLGGVITMERSPPSSSMARRACSSVRALPCQPSLFSSIETPWPFSVLATTSVGAAPSDACEYAASIAETSCPSITSARHPKARARSA